MAVRFTLHQLTKIEDAARYRMAHLNPECHAYAEYIDLLETVNDIRNETIETGVDADLAANGEA